MGYIGKLTRMDKTNKLLYIDGKEFRYFNVVKWAERIPVGTKVSYSHYANNITWIGVATPEYIRVAKELKKKFGGKKKVKASRALKTKKEKKHGRK